MIMNRHKMRTEINNTSCYHPLQLTGHKYKFPCHGMCFYSPTLQRQIRTHFNFHPLHNSFSMKDCINKGCLSFEKGIYLVGLVENNACSSRKLSSNFTIEPIILLHSFIQDLKAYLRK